MAGLSIARRRKAWLKGVAYGASGKGVCLLHVPKLQEIFQKGVVHGRDNANSPLVRTIVEQENRRREPSPNKARRVQQLGRPRQRGGGGPQSRGPQSRGPMSGGPMDRFQSRFDDRFRRRPGPMR